MNTQKSIKLCGAVLTCPVAFKSHTTNERVGEWMQVWRFKRHTLMQRTCAIAMHTLSPHHGSRKACARHTATTIEGRMKNKNYMLISMWKTNPDELENSMILLIFFFFSCLRSDAADCIIFVVGFSCSRKLSIINLSSTVNWKSVINIVACAPCCQNFRIEFGESFVVSLFHKVNADDEAFGDCGYLIN